MVQAILAERKTQTRRKINGVDDFYYQSLVNHAYGTHTFAHNKSHEQTHPVVKEIECPYGKKGDVLWVRETLEQSVMNGALYRAGGKVGDTKDNPLAKNELIDWDDFSTTRRVIPAIHMPKRAARIWLKIKAIKIERLQDISDDAAIQEGIEEIHPAPFVIRYKNYLDTKNQTIFKDPKMSFRTLWESINGFDDWHVNPWVWVIEFERIEKPENV